MPCNICGEEYRGLAGDCACTMYGFADEAEFRREASEHEIRAYERMHPPTMPPNETFREGGAPVAPVLCTLAIILFVVYLLSGCSIQQINDAFELSEVEHARKYEGGTSHWTIEDIHVYANRAITDKYHSPKKPELNGHCLEAAEMKFELAVSSGYSPFHMEIVVISLHDDVAISRDVESGTTHAMLKVGGTIYDNGFLADVPFDEEELERYGKRIPDTWSKYRR